jgi:hypothetical protein
MATSTKVLCVICDKGKGTFKCEGCLQTFCSKHSTNHRNELGQQLEEIEIKHDLVQQTLNQQIENIHEHCLVKKINQWEEQSIQKIRLTGEDLRNQLFQHITKHTNDIKEKLQDFSNELRQSREEDDFIETDLRQWKIKLEELEKNLLASMTLIVREESSSFIDKISIECNNTLDIFEHIYGDARLEENGQLVIKDILGGHTEIRGKNGYFNGRHKIDFSIEEFPVKGWIFFGIVSKSQRMQFNSYSLPSSYGWATTDQIFLAGQLINQQTYDVIQNDIITLWIDCYQKKIQLKNQQTNRDLELSVDINKCQFPWQFHINLSRTPNRIRILPSLED